jgi:hypothetical protein
MFTVIARYNSAAVDSFECETLPQAKTWGKEQLQMHYRVNNASIFSEDYNFKTLHASLTRGVVRWKASKL